MVEMQQEDKFLKAKLRRDAKRKEQNKQPYNMKVGFNLFQFNKFDIDENEHYKNNDVVQFGQCILFSEAFFGSNPIQNCLINVSPNLYERICTLIINKYGSFNNSPANICFLIRRYDNYDRTKDAYFKEKGIINKRGRVKYLIGLINEEEFNKLSNWIKYNKDKEKLEHYLTE